MGNESPYRPNPDALLDAVTRKAEDRRKGKLKIFLGMSAGVGKTYAMLGAARELAASGVDVVAGYIETHGRTETDALADGLETIPRRVVPYRDVTLEEMDIDAVLKRSPQVALVDEAAHTNAPGSRHIKRWHDIVELIDSGINVYTTLNIQHIESLTDTVREITGVNISETVPDTVIDMADEIVLVDIPPDELIKRLDEGKVYGDGRAGHAMQNFFRPGNLSALRELSLRLVAERVNRDLRDYRSVHNITDTWKTRHRLMVAVYASPYSETLIRWTRRLASALDAEWTGAYVESDAQLSDAENKLLTKNLALVSELGGNVLTTVGDDPVSGLIRLARENQITQIVVGKSRRGFVYNLLHRGSIVERILRESGDIDVYIASGEPGTKHQLGEHKRTATPKAWFGRDILLAAISLAACFIAGHIINPFIAYRAVGLVFLLGMTLLGMFVERGTFIVAAILCGLMWNFFFIPPYYTFYISAPEDFMMFTMFLATSLVIGHLTSRLRRNEKHLRLRERRTASLYHFTEDISSTSDMGRIIENAIRHITSDFDSEATVFLRDSHAGTIKAVSSIFTTGENAETVAEWTILHNRPAGLFTDTFPNSDAMFLPLMASQGTVGSLALKPRRKQSLTPELNLLAETFARQLAMGIEREQLNELARRTMLLQESERLYKAILNSVSHELKTPLATIEGSASALLDPMVGSDPASLKLLADEILGASHRLSHLVKNLLDMTRLESGVIPLRAEPCDVKDLVCTTLRQLGRELDGHTVSTKFQPDSPLIEMDFLLMEQAIGNILLNAAMHTPAGTHIEIVTQSDDTSIRISISDNGPGLPSDNPAQALVKFWRADPHKPGGTGLGLTIANGWVEAHGGTLAVRNRSEGGAQFTITLPLERHK